MEQLKISELYQDLNQTLAKELLESKTYPWEVLPLISEFIVKPMLESFIFFRNKIVVNP